MNAKAVALHIAALVVLGVVCLWAFGELTVPKAIAATLLMWYAMAVARLSAK